MWVQVETEILPRFQQDFGVHEGRIIEVKAAREEDGVLDLVPFTFQWFTERDPELEYGYLLA